MSMNFVHDVYDSSLTLPGYHELRMPLVRFRSLGATVTVRGLGSAVPLSLDFAAPVAGLLCVLSSVREGKMPHSPTEAVELRSFWNPFTGRLFLSDGSPDFTFWPCFFATFGMDCDFFLSLLFTPFGVWIIVGLLALVRILIEPVLGAIVVLSGANFDWRRGLLPIDCCLFLCLFALIVWLAPPPPTMLPWMNRKSGVLLVGRTGPSMRLESIGWLLIGICAAFVKGWIVVAIGARVTIGTGAATGTISPWFDIGARTLEFPKTFVSNWYNIWNFYSKGIINECRLLNLSMVWFKPFCLRGNCLRWKKSPPNGKW